MAVWRKALVGGLAVLVGAFPVLARVDPGLPTSATVAQQAKVVLPQGRELGDEELLQAEGEFWWFIAEVLFGAAIGAGTAAIKENGFDEEPGIDADDRREIAFGAMVGAMTGGSGALTGRFVPK
ncbi:MAG: hypothetical protein ACP5HG_17670 [Anaerolineae bacterium]